MRTAGAKRPRKRSRSAGSWAISSLPVRLAGVIQDTGARCAIITTISIQVINMRKKQRIEDVKATAISHIRKYGGFAPGVIVCNIKQFDRWANKRFFWVDVLILTRQYLSQVGAANDSK